MTEHWDPAEAESSTAKASDPREPTLKSTTSLLPEDTAKWDNFVKSHARGSIYHLSGWAGALEAAFPHIKSRILTVVDDHPSDISAGLPIFLSKNLFGRTKLMIIPFALHGDVLASSEENISLLYDKVLEIYRQVSASKVEIRSSHPQPYLGKIGYEHSSNYTHQYLSLDCDPEVLKSNFHKKGVQVPIRKALESPIELRKGNSISDLMDFYNILCASRRRVGLPRIPLLFFTSLLDNFDSNKHIDILIAKYKGIPIGASLLLKFKDEAIIEYGGDLVEYRKFYTNHFLDWSAVKLAYEAGFKILSFGRTSEKNSGLVVYKNRWGTKTERLHIYRLSKQGKIGGSSREESKFYSATRKILQKCPDVLYRNLSKIIYKQIQ